VRGQQAVIVNRVSALMGERRANMQDVATATGIAYSSVFALYHDKVTRYDRETLDRLCRYFGCGVGDLLLYQPDHASAQGEGTAGQPATDQPS
jgi:putative transcriptional regulator